MNSWIRTTIALALAAPILALPTPASAGVGDLLVAPTRIIIDGRKGTEIILNNIGEEPATYRVSVEFRRMLEDGSLEDVKDPSAAEKLAEEMIIYAPRRVTLAPREPQAIRIAARAPQGIADGEYRIHLLFRAVPPPEPVVSEAAAKQVKGVSFQLRPIYGVTIPVIVRLGNLQATAGISDVQIDKSAAGRAISLELSRSGTRSTFGEVRVLKPGVKDPIALQRAVAVYTEVGKRRVLVPVDDRFKGEIAGPVTVQYAETYEDGSRVIAETQTVLH